MDARVQRCPDCHEPLHQVLAQCWCWTPVESGDSFLNLGVEALYKCDLCGQAYFADEAALLEKAL
jgi:hypothetical protein